MLLVVFNMCLCLSFAYKLKCPEESQWAIRARGRCVHDPSNYFCLWDGNAKEYIEGCKKADFTRSGERYEWWGNFDSKHCPKNYQPYLHWTNESSGCIYKKSPCNEEGQVVYNNTDTKRDTKCTCDYTKGYDFITKPNNPCYCIPAEEDCSCYLNPCLMPRFEADDRCTGSANLTDHDNCVRLPNQRKEDTKLLDEKTNIKGKNASGTSNSSTVNYIYVNNVQVRQYAVFVIILCIFGIFYSGKDSFMIIQL